MGNRPGPTVVGLVTVSIVVATLSSGVGLVGATTVTPVEETRDETVYPGQTVPVLEFEVESEDAGLSEGVSEFYGSKGSSFTPSSNQLSEVYLVNGESRSEYHAEDPIVKITRLSNYNQGNFSGKKLGNFGKNIYYIDEDWNDNYENELVIRSINDPGIIVKNDEILRKAPINISDFQNSRQPHQFLSSPNSESNGLDAEEPIFSTGEINELEPGSLSSGNSQLVRRGIAPIKDISKSGGEYYFIDRKNKGNVGTYDIGDLVISDDGDKKLTSGSLGYGNDRVLKTSPRTLQSFENGNYYILNTNRSEKDELNPNEVIVEDNGEAGVLDTLDQVVSPGFANVEDIHSNSASFETGDIYIGNSDDSIYESEEFIYVEEGTTPGYNSNEDLVIAFKGSLPTSNTSTTSKVNKETFTNIAYLDLNEDGKLNTRSENTNTPGTEPIIEFQSLSRSFAGSRVESSSQFAKIPSSTENILDVQGAVLDEGIFSDITAVKGPYEQGKLVYVEGSENGMSGSIIVEVVSPSDGLTNSDYIVKESVEGQSALKYFESDIEFVDENSDGLLNKSEYLIESYSPDDDIIESRDKVISEGNISRLSNISKNIEFFDLDGDEQYDTQEPIIRSNKPGDDISNISDDILMSTIQPGRAKVNKFESWSKDKQYSQEMYIDDGLTEAKYDYQDQIVRLSLVKGTNESNLDEYVVRDFDDAVYYIDLDENGSFSNQDKTYREKDDISTPSIFGDRLTTLTVTNTGTLPDEAIESVSLRQGETELTNVSDADDGVWTLEVPDSAGLVGTSGNSTNFSVHATVGPDADPGETVAFSASRVTDRGEIGVFDDGDHGAFFHDRSPIGGITSNRSYTVANPAAIDASASSLPDPERVDGGVVELAFTDSIAAASTEPTDFNVTTLQGTSANVTGLRDDDGDERLLLTLDNTVPPIAVRSVEIDDEALRVTSGALVPAQHLDVERSSVAVTEARARNRVAYRGSTVAVLANEGNESNSTGGNLDEEIRIDRDTSGDGSGDELRFVGSTGPASQVHQFETAASNVSGYRIEFKSEDGSPGDTAWVSVESLSLAVTANSTNTTDVAGPISAVVSTVRGPRTVRAALHDVDANRTITSKMVSVDRGSNRSRVAFEPRVGNVSIAVTDLGTGATNRTETISVRKGHPSASFVRETYVQERGDIATIDVTLTDTTNATLSIGDERVNYHERVPIRDHDGDGMATVRVNTFRAGSGAPGTGIEPGDPTNRSADRDRLGPVRRTAPVGRNLTEPLDVGIYPLSLSRSGEIVDVSSLEIRDRSLAGASTLVAPADATLNTTSALANRTTERQTVAIGDQAVVAVNVSGIGGVVDETTDFREGSPSANRTGAFLDVRRRNSPPNRPARTLNVSRAPTTLDREADALYLLVRSEGSVHGIEAGETFNASFVLDDTSPFVGSAGASNESERESVSTPIRFVEPSGSFSGLANGSLDLPGTAAAAIDGTTNVAPGTTVTVAVTAEEDDGFRETDTTTVESDGSFSGTVDLSTYEGGTTYDVVATANDEELTAVRTGAIVEREKEPAADVSSQRVPSGSRHTGGDGQQSSVESTTVTATSTTPTTVPTSTPLPRSVRERAETFVNEEVPQFVATRATGIVLGLGAVAVLYALIGLRRLVR